MLGETKGIILYQKNHKEKDKLVKIFTEQYGKMVFYVKHVQKKNNPLKAAILPMTTGTYIGEIKKEGLSFLNAAKKITPFLYLQQDIFANAYATYWLGLVDACLEDKKADPFLFSFLKEALKQLNDKKDAEILSAIFEIQLLPRFGITLQFDHCAICQKKEGQMDFSYRYNGLLCHHHFYKDERRFHANPKAIYLISLFSSVCLSQIGQIHVSKKTKQDLRKIIDELYEEYVGLHLKSKHFIDEMKKWEKIIKDD